MLYDVYTQLEIEQELEENADYLAHHGRLGQRKGVRNGPPYPLDYSKLSDEEKKAAKEDAIRRGDVKEAEANKEHYTDDELNKVINRYNLNNKLANINQEKVLSTWDKIKDVGDKMNTASNAIGNASNLYNNIAKVSNAFLGSDLPVIGEKKGGDGKKDNNGGGNNNNNNQKKEEKKPDRIIRTYNGDQLKGYVRKNADGTGVEKSYVNGKKVTQQRTRKNLAGNYVTTSRVY